MMSSYLPQQHDILYLLVESLKTLQQLIYPALPHLVSLALGYYEIVLIHMRLFELKGYNTSIFSNPENYSLTEFLFEAF